MHEVLLALAYIFTSFVGSMFAFLIWVHFDLEGFIQEQRQKRAIRLGKKREERVFNHRVQKSVEEERMVSNSLHPLAETRQPLHYLSKGNKSRRPGTSLEGRQTSTS